MRRAAQCAQGRAGCAVEECVRRGCRNGGVVSRCYEGRVAEDLAFSPGYI